MLGEQKELNMDVKEYIKQELSNIYCDTCANNGNDDRCDDCHRKHISWEISDQKAQRMADEITKALKIVA